MAVFSRFWPFWCSFCYCDSYLLANHVYFAKKIVPRRLFLAARRLQTFYTVVKCLLLISRMRLPACRNCRFSRFLTFFWSSFFIMTHIYRQTKYILQKNCPQMSFPGRGEAPNIWHPLLKGPHRLVSWVGQSTKGGQRLFEIFPKIHSFWYCYPSLKPLWLQVHLRC